MSILSRGHRLAMKRLSVDAPRPSLRHLPTAIAFAAALLLTVLFRALLVTHPLALIWSALVMVLATILAALYSLTT